MYDELVKRLRDAAKMSDAFAVLLPHSEGNATAKLYNEAADVIEKLSAKATPKRVGFTGWKGCRDTRYKCPICTKYVRNDEKYCHKCGQALMFPIISHTPYEPGKRQEVIISWPDEPPKEE